MRIEMRKILLSVMLSVAMVLTMIPMSGNVAFASEEDQNVVYDELFEADSLSLTDGKTYTFNKGLKVTNNLIIEGCTVIVPAGGIQVSSGNVSIDNSEIQITRNDETNTYGMEVNAGELTIKDSSLSVDLIKRSSGGFKAYKKITADNSTINIDVDNGNGAYFNDAEGFWCSSDSDSDIILSKCSISIYAPEGSGISAYRGDLTLTDTSAELLTGSTGLSSGGNLVATNCELSVNGGKERALSGGQPNGLFAYDNVIVEGGTLFASSLYGDGIYANDVIEIKNGTESVSAQGKIYAMRAGNQYHKGDINIGDKLEISKPVNGSYDSDNGYFLDKDGNVAASVVISSPKKSISKMEATLEYSNIAYTGAALKPGVTIKGLTAETDYSVKYTNNTKAGTATVTIEGIGNYTGTLTKTFTIKPASITGKTAALSSTSYTYNGRAKAPTVTIKGLTKGVDFKVSYSNNTNAGTGKVTITGIGNYTGTLTKTFTIKPASISGKTMTVSTSAYTYDGNLKKPTVKITGLTAGTDFKVTYSNNKYVGKATAKATGTGNYTGSLTKTFKINPKGTTIRSLSAGTKAFTAKWNKQATQTSGYQIRYSRNSDMSSAKTVTISGTSTVSKTVKSLYAKKKYYVQVRTYKTVDSVKYYSSWSAKKYVTTK